MYKLLLFFVTVFSFSFLHAQTFNGAGGPVATGTGTALTTCYSVTVTGVGVIDATYGLASVCLNITHPFDGDLTLSLVAPNGYTVALSNQHGSSQDNYTNTCFSMTGTVNISGGTPPYTGTYLPDQNLGNMNSGQNADGVWSLCVLANFNFDIGTLNNWSLVFNNTPAPPPAVIPNCVGNPPAGDDCAHATPVCNFDGYCGNTSSAYLVDTWSELSTAFCGSIENNSFITFVASATTANFNVFVSNSQNGDGIQMFFYDGGCGSGAVNTYGCYSPLAPDVISPVTATGLTPGNTYYLMFDGWSGDVCDYTIIPLDGVNILTITPDAASICVGQSVDLTAAGGNGTYNWAGPNLSATTGVTVTATPTVTSTYTVTSVDPTGACPVTKTMTITITNTPPPPVVTSPVTLCQGSVATALTATGINLNWFTTATGGTANTTAPVPSTTTVGTTTYYVSQTLICGESVRVPIDVIVVALPAAPTVTTPVTYCQGSVAAILTATGTGLLWYTTATGGTGTAAAPLPSTTTIGNTIYYVSQTVATCEGPRSAITVTVVATPAAPVVTSPISYCQGNTATALTATGINLLWYTTATGGTGVATAPTPATTTVGSTTWYVSQATGSCRGPRSPVVVNVVLATPAPTTAPVTYCQGASAVPLTATGTALLWYTAATGGTGSATAPTPSTATIGSTTYYVTQTLSCGESPRTTLVVTITTTPAAPIVTSPVAYCQGSTATALTATGTNLLWYTTATGGTGSAIAPTPSTATVGNTIYYVSQSTGACEGPRAAITVTINSIPAAPAITTPVNYCKGTTATALTATGTGLLWYTAATGGSGSATAPIPSTATVGNSIYYVSQTIASCESPRAAITVTILAPTAAPTVTSPVTYCQGATATALTATGTALVWYTVATGGTGSATAPVPLTATVGSTTYYVSQNTLPCGESVRTPLVVNITSTPGAPVVNSPVIYCQGTTATALTATGTSLLWYTTATGGTGSAAAPVPSTITTGNTTYYVSQTTGVCEGPRAAITVTINSIPAAPIVNPVTYCQTITATALTATGSNLLWYTAATGGAGNATAPTPSTATPGNINYYVSQTVNSCESPRASITVTTLPSTPAPTVTSPISYCQGVTATALTATGTTLVWYTTATGGTGSGTAPTPSTTTVGSTTYYVTQNTAPCGESVRTPLVVNVTSTPAVPTVNSPVVYCQGTTATALTATGTSLLWYASATGGTGSATAPVPSTATVGSLIYYVSQSTGVCEGPRTAIIVTVNSVPAAPVVNPVTYCQTITATALIAAGSNLLWYTSATGGAGNVNAPTPSTTTPGNVNYYVTQTVNNCESPRASITVTTLPSTPAPTVTSPISYCQGVTATALTATGTTLVWYTTATGGTGSGTAPTPSTTTVGSTTYYVTQNTAPCGESVRTPLVVNVTSTPAVPTVNSPVVYCQGTTATALTATGTSLLWYASATGGTGSATAPVPSTATVGSLSYYVSQSTGVCEGPRTAIIVTVNIVPAAPVVNPVTYCQTITATALTAAGSNLLWYTSATGGAGNVNAPTPSTTTPGNVNYYVTQTVNNCESPRASLTVTTLPSTPAPTATTPVIFCQGTTATALTATGTLLLWYTTATGGTGSATAPIPSTTTIGSTSYYVSQTTAPCGESVRTHVIVTINGIPVAPTTSPLVICQATTAAPLTATGTNLLWYTAASGGTSSTSMAPSTTNVGNTTYYVSQTVATCEGPRAPLLVTIVALPPAPIGSGPFTYCQGTTATQLTATGNALLWYTVPTGGTGSTTAPTPSTATAGIFTFYVTQSMSCGESVRTPVVVTVNPTPQAPSVISPVTYCQGTTTTAVTATGSNLLWYSAETGGIGNPVAPVPSSVNVNNTTYYVSSTLGVCEGPRAALTVIVNVTPPAPAVGGSVTYCQASVAPALSATGTNILWYNGPAGGIGTTNAPANYTGIVGNTTYYCSQTTGVCEGPRAAINVTINPYPDFGPNQADTVCFGDSVNLSAKFNTTGYTIKWTLEGQEVTTPEAVRVTGVYQLEATNSFGCSDTVLVVVKIQPLVPAYAGGDTTAVKGVPHMLVGSGGVSYLWSPAYPLNAADAQYPLATLDHDQLFTLTVTDIAGCIGTSKVFVKVYEGPTYYIPNAFSPNGDGLNDIFRVVPVGIVYTDYFKIFNRYGQLVFETKEWMKGWDGTYKGKKQPIGNYVWAIRGLDKYGKAVEMKGTVLLVQ